MNLSTNHQSLHIYGIVSSCFFLHRLPSWCPAASVPPPVSSQPPAARHETPGIWFLNVWSIDSFVTRSWHSWPHPCLRPPQSCQSMWSPATFQCINNFNHSHFATQYQCPIHIHRPHNSKIHYCRKTIAISSEQKSGPWKRPTFWPCHKRIIAIWDAPPLPTVAQQSFIFRGSM